METKKLGIQLLHVGTIDWMSASMGFEHECQTYGLPLTYEYWYKKWVFAAKLHSNTLGGWVNDWFYISCKS